MEWATRRKILYGVSCVLLVAATSVYVFRDTLFPAPTCFDTRQNGYETGVDCGGGCALRCTQDVVPLAVLWSKAVPTREGVYDIVAMVNNRNVDSSPLFATYAMTLFDTAGGVLAQVFGSSSAPVSGTFPIIIQNVALPSSPVNVATTIAPSAYYASSETARDPAVRVLKYMFDPQATTPRLYVTIKNVKRTAISNLRVRIVVYDVNDNAIAVGESVVPSLDKEEVEDVVYTWPTLFTHEPVRVQVFPIIDPFMR